MELKISISGQLSKDSETRIESALKGIGCLLPCDTYILAHAKFERNTYSVSVRAGSFDAVFATQASSSSLNQMITTLEANIYRQIREWKETQFLKEKQILIVDDNPLIHMLLKKVLAGSTIKVSTAATLSEARELIRNNQFSLLFLDYDLGDEKGFELLNSDSFASQSPLPFIMFSSYGPFQEVPQSNKSFQMLGQIPKDLDYHDLARYVNHYVAA